MHQAVGDSGGEHLDMPRGHYNAWLHVVLSVLFQLIFWAALVPYWIGLLLGPSSLIAAPAGFRFAFAAASVALVALIYWDRWRCIEAFSSRFCSGASGISLIYVPAIAFIYANYRGIMKLFRR